jgi:hypothetical protein
MPTDLIREGAEYCIILVSLVALMFILNRLGLSAWFSWMSRGENNRSTDRRDADRLDQDRLDQDRLDQDPRIVGTKDESRQPYKSGSVH